MKIVTHIMSGAGNIFSVIDNRDYGFDKDVLKSITQKICYANPDKPTEGFIAINAGDEEYDFHADFFNPDGSFGAMCGNGGRCAVWFANHNGMINNTEHCVFTMANAVYYGSISNGTVSVDFPPPIFIDTDINLSVHNAPPFQGGYINVGSDHFITEIDTPDFSSFPLREFAPPIRHHAVFQPRGVNVNIFRLDTPNNKVMMRTYERGVEAETGACGTGAISTALYIALTKHRQSPITLVPTSGEELTVCFTLSDTKEISTIRLQGNARFLDSFEIDLPL